MNEAPRRERPNSMQRIAFVAVFAVAAAAASAAHAAEGGPMAQLKQSNDKIDRILKRKPAAGSAEEKSSKEELKTIVNGLIDYGELARRSLAQHWETLSHEKQEHFVTTLRDLIEKNYVRQLRTNLDYTVLYKNEQVAEDGATVQTIVKIKTKGKSTESSIDYKLRKVGEKWQVFDIITDDVSMVKNYKQQFNKIITNEGYDKLIEKMKKRIDESEQAK